MIKSTIYLSYDEIKNLEKGKKLEIVVAQEDDKGRIIKELKNNLIELEIVYNDEIVA